MATQFEFYQYVADNGDFFNIKLSKYNGTTVLGLTPVVPDANPPWPYHEKGLRHIDGEFTDGSGQLRYRRLIIPVLANALYSSDAPQTWADQASNTVQRTGRFGEKRSMRIV